MAGQQPVRPLGMVHGNSAIPVSALGQCTCRLCGRCLMMRGCYQAAFHTLSGASSAVAPAPGIATERTSYPPLGAAGFQRGYKLTELSRRGAQACS